jgi:allophanate hydrolase
MADAHLTVTHVGPITTIQDAGRPGLMRFGVPSSGPMDRRSFAIANAALGNAIGASAVEVSIGGLTLECVAGAVTVAIAGGGFRVEADEVASPSWTVRTLHPGSTLSIKPGPWGSWTYIAFAGALEADTWLGSSATHVLSGRGGGRIAAGQRLVVRGAGVRGGAIGTIPFPVTARPRSFARVVLGPQERFFSRSAIDDLLSKPFSLTAAYDRMGVRLNGPAITPDRPLDMPSEPILRGSIQVAGDGVATVLLADHQTTGGYPKIATIIADDVDGFTQLRSRESIGFRRISPEDAVAVARTCRAGEVGFLEALRGAAARHRPTLG